MNIRLKFSLFISGLLVCVVVGIAISIFFAQKMMLKEQFEKNRENLFKDISFTAKGALIVGDEILVDNILKAFVETHRPHIVYAGYISPPPRNIKFFSVRDRNKENYFLDRITHTNSTKPNINIIFSMNDNEEIYEYSIQIISDNNSNLGTLRIGFSQNYLNKQIDETIAVLSKKITNIAILTILIGLALANFVAYLMVLPIKKLTQASVELGSGNLDVQVDVKRKDEIGSLAENFNEMAKKLKQLDELKDAFVSSVSHELRSPLSAIDGYCDYLIDGLKEHISIEKQQKALNIIKDSVNRLTTFINNILDLAKIKAGRFELHRIPVKVEEIIQEIVALFLQMAIKQQKTLKIQIQENLPPIYADPERIKQVITNLIGNALKFTEQNAEIIIGAKMFTDGVLIGYGRRQTDKDVGKEALGRFVEIWVSDNGIGIPKEELDKIFDKFYQVGVSGPGKPKGTGLGLSIAAEIVKLHGGKIGVESTFGKGSTFKFIIPIWNE